jgi:hypothetical protein
MEMRRAVVMLGLVALAAAQSGCVDPCDTAGNGNEGVLSFRSLQFPAQGLQTQVTLLRAVPGMWEGLFLSRSASSCFQFDDAVIEVTLPPAFQGEGVSATRSFEGDFDLRFRCSAPDGVTQRVPVKVLAGGTARYEDSFDIVCHSVASASANAVEGPRPLSRKGYVVGGLVHAALTVRDAGGTTLTGFGATPVDAMLAPFGEPDLLTGRETFRTTAPGQSPVLQVGSLRATLPITVVDDAAWELSLEVRPGSSSGLFDFTAFPKTPSGDTLDGMEVCQWTAAAGTEGELLPDTTCDLTHSNTLPGVNRFITRMCVTAVGRTKCAEVSQ